MITNIEGTIVFDDVNDRITFSEIKRLGFTNDGGPFIIDGRMECGGCYFTTIPISPLWFRKERGRGEVCFSVKDDTLIIKDDYGREYSIASSKDTIALLVKECEKAEIPQCK